MRQAEEARDCMTEQKDNNTATETVAQAGDDYVFEAAASFAQQRRRVVQTLQVHTSEGRDLANHAAMEACNQHASIHLG